MLALKCIYDRWNINLATNRQIQTKVDKAVPFKHQINVDIYIHILTSLSYNTKRAVHKSTSLLGLVADHVVYSRTPGCLYQIKPRFIHSPNILKWHLLRLIFLLHNAPVSFNAHQLGPALVYDTWSRELPNLVLKQYTSVRHWNVGNQHSKCKNYILF